MPVLVVPVILSPKSHPATFSQEYFQEIALVPATEDTTLPHRTNLAKKAARLQELKKTMNDVSGSGRIVVVKDLMTSSFRAHPLGPHTPWI
jgi:hypothetical protein